MWLQMALHPDFETIIFLDFLGSGFLNGIQARLVWNCHLHHKGFPCFFIMKNNVRLQIIWGEYLFNEDVYPFLSPSLIVWSARIEDMI